MTLTHYTWDQAEILGLATTQAFKAIGIPPGTIRRWASEHRIHAAGKAPGGAHLYEIREVSEVAETIKATPRREDACK